MSNAHTLRYGSILLTAFLISALAVSPALASHSPEHYSLFGGATYDSPGNASNRAIELESDADTAFSGISYPVEDGVTFAELTQLSTDYKFDSGSCVGGSPRYQIGIDTDGDGDRDGNIFAYFGTDSGGAPCVSSGTWANTGDFLEANRTLDTSQLSGGAFYDPYASALTKYGAMEVTGIQLVDDSGWTGTAQVVDVDNTLVNSTLFTYEIPTATSKEQCKKGGWMTRADGEGNTFKNQGQCVSYTQKNK